MRSFEDATGQGWTATVQRRPGINYKGRFFLVLESGEERLPLDDVRWNNPATAERTLAMMSEVELRRRLRSARGRAGQLVRP